MALAMPQAVEASHRGHPDFRVGGKVFATLGWPNEAFAMVKLTPDQQAKSLVTAPGTFLPVPGGWGRRGSTKVELAAADKAAVSGALATAWRNVASKKLPAPAESPLLASSPRRCPLSRPDADLRPAFARVLAALERVALPEVEQAVSFGTPSLRLRRKFLMRVKDEDTLVFRCPLDDKAMLLEAAPEIYFESEHYRGWPAVLVRLAKADDAEIGHCLMRAWRMQAPRRLVAQFEGQAGMQRGPSRKSPRSR